MTTILVTGATGNVGSRAVRELRARGASVRAFVRDPDKAARLFDDAVELAVGDFADAASLQRAMQGVDAVLLSVPNHPNQVEHETAVIDAAVTAGVRRFAKVSTTSAQPGSSLAFFDAHGRSDAYLRRAIPNAVILASSCYMTNLLTFADQIRSSGGFFAPAAGALISLIDPRDVAAVAALVLTDGGYEGETLALTGPEAITFVRVAEELSAVTGSHVEFVGVPDEAAHQGLLAAGVPPWLAENIVKLYGELRAGVASETTNTVRRVTGRDPGTFAQFARAHAEAFQQPASFASTT
jgi:uncharacterized protein YbjT (DUF2867 family)